MKLGGVRLKIPIGGCFSKNWKKLVLLKSKGLRTPNCQEVEGFHGVLETDGICGPQNQDVVYVEDGPNSLNA
jgi:hypothetical protein